MRFEGAPNTNKPPMSNSPLSPGHDKLPLISIEEISHFSRYCLHLDKSSDIEMMNAVVVIVDYFQSQPFFKLDDCCEVRFVCSQCIVWDEAFFHALCGIRQNFLYITLLCGSLYESFLFIKKFKKMKCGRCVCARKK